MSECIYSENAFQIYHVHDNVWYEILILSDISAECRMLINLVCSTSGLVYGV